VSRPAVSVVVPFAGDAAQALVAVALLRALRTRPGDQLLLADNCRGVAPASAGITVVAAEGERSPAHARNAGAARAATEWILFLDADTRAPPGLLDLYFAEPIDARVGALAGEIVGVPGARTVAARYGAARNFLGQQAHLAHPYRPRAAAANLLVRREAFEAVGGFREGLRAAEDTDFCWRLQDLGWTLGLCPGAVVEHEYRAGLRELRRQWRGYAAGRAWLAREYPGFHPQPAAARALRRLGGGRRALGPGPAPAAPAPALPGTELGTPAPRSRLERARFAAIDVLLAVEELIGLRMSNRPEAQR
jgi:hypothetical protein